MPLDFPTSPSLNDTYTSGTSSWRWNGTAWVALGMYTVVTGPAGPQGETGATGATGAQGPQGNVSSAFTVAMATAL
jgi:hypothetical protein